MVLLDNSSAIITENISLIYKNAPFYMNIWFYIGCFAIILMLLGFAWVYFQYNIKNRTNFRIHMPDHKVITYSFKNIVTEWHSFQYGKNDKDAQGNKNNHKHHVVPECIEFGFFGRYLDYVLGDVEPINFRKLTDKNNFSKADFTKAMESYLNSETLANLLLIGKLKDLLITLLTIILISVIVVGIVLLLVQILHHPATTCTLSPTNQTINTIRMAMTT